MSTNNTPATTPADGDTPSVYAQGILSDAEALRVLLKNMLDEDQFDRADNLLRAIEEGIEEAMSDAYAQGEQEAKDRATPSPAQAASADVVTDEQIIALADRGEHLTPSPSKYPELGHGTQYHCGAPGLLGFARALLSLATPSPGKAPEPVAWRHEIVEPTGQHLTLYSASPDNPWSHWLGQYRDECRYTATPLYASPGKAEAERWQPIETAPKDGTEIWAFNGEQARIKWSEGEEWALWCWADEHLSDVDPNPEQPTHWMPLPAAPSAIQQERDK